MSQEQIQQGNRELDDQVANDVIFTVLSRTENPEQAIAVLAAAVARLARDDSRDAQWLRDVVSTAYDVLERPKPVVLQAN